MTEQEFVQHYESAKMPVLRYTKGQTRSNSQLSSNLGSVLGCKQIAEPMLSQAFKGFAPLLFGRRHSAAFEPAGQNEFVLCQAIFEEASGCMKTFVARKHPTLPDETFLRTPNANCPACIEYRWHREEEWKTFHPHAGEGINPLIRSVKQA